MIVRSGVQWITTCSAANVNIGQLLVHAAVLHTVRRAGAAQGLSQCTMQMQINFTPVILGTGLQGSGSKLYRMLSYTVHALKAARLLRLLLTCHSHVVRA